MWPSCERNSATEARNNSSLGKLLKAATICLKSCEPGSARSAASTSSNLARSTGTCAASSARALDVNRPTKRSNATLFSVSPARRIVMSSIATARWTRDSAWVLPIISAGPSKSSLRSRRVDLGQRLGPREPGARFDRAGFPVPSRVRFRAPGGRRSKPPRGQHPIAAIAEKDESAVHHPSQQLASFHQLADRGGLLADRQRARRHRLEIFGHHYQFVEPASELGGDLRRRFARRFEFGRFELRIDQRFARARRRDFARTIRAGPRRRGSR